jgi:thiol-disulfide isomerase/thioredoxin
MESIMNGNFILLILLLFVLPLNASENIRGHYEVVGKVPRSNSLDKVVFEEFMNFGCPHCNSLREESLNFRKQQKDGVEFIDIPIVFKGQDDAPLRFYYVARKLGQGDFVKEELFKARFIHGVDVFDKGIVNYIARSLGLSEAYQKEKNAPWVNQLIAEGELKAQRYGITGTPTVVLQFSLKMNIGRYNGMDKFAERLPETIDDLLKN